MAGLGENSGGNDVEKFYSQIEKALDQRIAQHKDSYGKGSQDVAALKKDVLALLKEEGALEDLRLDASDLLAVYQSPEVQDLCNQLGIQSFDDFWRELGIVEYSFPQDEMASTEYAEGLQSVLINGLKVPVILPSSLDRNEIMAIERLVGKIKAHTELHRYFTAETKIESNEHIGYLRFEIRQDGKNQPYMVTAKNFFRVLYEPTKEQVEEYYRVNQKYGHFLNVLFDLNRNNKSFAKKGEIVKKQIEEERNRLDNLYSEARKKLSAAKKTGEGVQQARAEFVAAKKNYDGYLLTSEEESWKVAVAGNKDYEEIYRQYKHFKDLTNFMQKEVIPWMFLDIESGKAVRTSFGQNPGDLFYNSDGKDYVFDGFDRYYLSWEEDEKSFGEMYNAAGKLINSSLSDPGEYVDVSYRDDGSFIKSNRDFATDIEVQETIVDGQVKEAWWRKGYGHKYYKGEVYDKNGSVLEAYKGFEDGRYEWTYLDPNMSQIIKKTGNYFLNGVEGQYATYYKDNKPSYTQYYDKKYDYAADMYNEDGSRFSLYNKTEYPSKEDYLNMLAKELNTPEKLGLFFKLFFEYKYDDVRGSWGMLASSGAEVWQSAQVTLDKVHKGMMQGDCEDWAFFATDVLKRQGRNVHVIIVPGHAASAWSEKRPDGKYDFYCLDTYGLNKALGVASPMEGLNGLIAHMGGRFVGVHNVSDRVLTGDIGPDGSPRQTDLPLEIFENRALYDQLLEANKLTESGNFSAAKEVYEKALVEYPGNKFLEEAMKKISKMSQEDLVASCIAKIDKGNATLEDCIYVDDYYRLKKMPGERVDFLTKWMDKSPSEARPYLVLTHMFYLKKDYKRSLEITERALKNVKEKALFYPYKIDIYSLLKKPDEVVKVYNESKEYLDSDWKYFVADYLEKAGRDEASLDIYGELVFGFEVKAVNPLNWAKAMVFDEDYAPTYPSAYYKYALHLAKRKDKEDALRVLKIGLKYYPEDRNLIALKDKLEGKSKAKLEVQGEKKYQKVGKE